MRFLCLSGAGTNAETFRAQIAPIVSDLERDSTASFHFINGEVAEPPPKGYEKFFGSPPHLRFFDSYIEGTTDEEFRDMFKRAPGTTVEQKCRYYESLGLRSTNSVRTVLDRLRRVVEEEGPFDGLIGNSEGACVAATFLIEELGRSKEKNGPSVRCAVFMSGGPPLGPDGQGPYLADVCGRLIDIPTLHIIGFNDPMKDATIALYHLCDEQSAGIVDHGKGHLVPQDPKSCGFMIKGIRDLILRTPLIGDRSARGPESVGAVSAMA